MRRELRGEGVDDMEDEQAQAEAEGQAEAEAQAQYEAEQAELEAFEAEQELGATVIIRGAQNMPWAYMDKE